MLETKKNLAYELGRYKKKVADDAKYIEELKAETQAYKQLNEMHIAIVAAVLNVMGHTDKEHALIVNREMVSRAVSEFEVIATPDTEQKAYTMYVRPRKEGG